MLQKVLVFVVDLMSPRPEFLHGCYSPCTGIVLKNSALDLGFTAWHSKLFLLQIIGIILHSPSLSAMNLVVLNAVSDCIFEPQVMGHPTYMIINPVLDFAVTLLRCAVSWYQFLQKSALHHSSRGDALGHILMPMSRVFMRYLLILRITCLCEDLEFAPCSAHCWTAYAMLGHVDFSKMLSWPRIRQ